MGGNLNIQEAMKHGYTRNLDFSTVAGQSESPKGGKKWLILGGSLAYSGAVNIELEKRYKDAGGSTPAIEKISDYTAAGAATYPLFNMGGEKDLPQWHPIFISDDEEIHFEAGAGGRAFITVLEWMA